MLAHAGKVRADRPIAGQARCLRIAERFGRGSSARDEGREGGIIRRLNDGEQRQNEDHRTTWTSVCP